ncbi:MAG: hypothetical protein LiPW15_216 [Parcubacteria group bacterium LiPW_15]|nr:MAG: hypothetical protein LiPW15_216 [Parcubacteria group bacterium LiPW_15]
MATEKRFVVLVEACNGSSGLTWSTVVLDTSDGARAIRTAREVEKLGYKIDWENEDQVKVLRLEPEKIYPERVFECADDSFDRSPVVYKRCRDASAGVLVEYFFDPKLAYEFGMSMATRFPSEPIEG